MCARFYAGHMSPIERRLGFFYFSYFAALGAFSPYFGPYLKSRGFDAIQVSMVMGLWYGTRIFAPNVWSALTERAASPIDWLRGGAVATMLACALFLLPLGYVGVLAVMLLFASLYNALMPQFEAITLSHLGARRDRYGKVRLFGSVGFLCVVLGAAQIFQYVGYTALILILLPLFALMVVAAWCNHYPTHAPDAPPPPQHAAISRWSVLRERPVQALLGAAFLNQVSHGPFYVFFSIYLGQHGHSASAIGQLWGIGVLCEIGLFWAMSGLLRRLSATTLLGIGLSIGVVRWSVVAAFPDAFWVVALSQIGHAFTFAVCHSALMMLLSNRFAGRDLEFGQALLYGISSGAGGVIGALLAGQLWTHWSDQGAFAFSALVSAFALLCLPTLRQLVALPSGR